MKLSNQNNAVLILLLHLSLIAIGMIVAYSIPLTEDPATVSLIGTEYLQSENHSEAELHSWLSFLELPHEETLIGKDTLSETLDKNKGLGTLDFFSNVAESNRVDYLADRISASAFEDAPYQWKITLQDASHEDADALLEALNIVQQQKFSDQAAAYDPPIEITKSEFAGVDSISPIHDRAVQFGKACPPAVGALLAVILVVVAWSLCMPGQRKLPFAKSISLLLVSTLMLSFVGAGIGYMFTAISGGEWESELAVEVHRNKLWPLVNLTPETQSLTEKLNQKIEVKNLFHRLNRKRGLETLINKKGMTTWRSFQQILNARGNEADEDVALDSDQLCDYIFDRLEIEQDPDASSIYTFRFRSEDKSLSRLLLTCLVDYCDSIWKEQREEIGVGGQLTRVYELDRLSNPKTEKVWRPWIASGHTFHGAFIGGIFSLVMVSSTRVFAGAPPI